MSSVKEALEQLVVKDQLEGVTCTKTNLEVAAWQQYTLEKLPMVLILHLKLFDYTMGGCTKILKTVMFPIELKIDTSELKGLGIFLISARYLITTKGSDQDFVGTNRARSYSSLD